MHARIVAAGWCGAAGLALAGCFHDAGNATGCAAFGCASETASAATTADETADDSSSPTTTSASSTGGSTTTSADATTSALPGIPLAGPVFRTTALELVDPRLYASDCKEISGFLQIGMMAAVQSHATNLLFAAMNYDADAAVQEFQIFRDGDCVLGEPYCVLPVAVAPAVVGAENHDVDPCVGFDAATINPDVLDDLHDTQAPCTIGPPTTMQVQLLPGFEPVPLVAGRFAARYVPDELAPTDLRKGVLWGFVPKAQAEQLTFAVEDVKFNLWASLRGSDHPDACPVPMDDLPGSVTDVDVLDMDTDGPEPPTPGVYLYLNFAADRVDAYAPF